MHKLIENQVRISVRNLVEFILRSGDIDNRHSTKAQYDAMQIGSRLHRKIQGSMPGTYKAEVSLKHTAHYRDVEILLEGRADGIITPDENSVNEEQANLLYQTQTDGNVSAEILFIIDEIKVIRQDMEKLDSAAQVHTAQALCYAYMYARVLNTKAASVTEENEENTRPCIGIQITYCHPETEEIKRFLKVYTFKEIKEEFDYYISEYGKWAQFLYEHRLERNASVQKLSFPYPYRAGQKRLVAAAYRTMINGEQLFIQAPTGIGKTLSTVFPAVWAVGEEYADKIFYLTAKTITRTAAVSAFDILRENGLKMSYIALTSKEKICPNTVMECNPVQCPYAKGHFDRVNEAAFDLIHDCEQITREKLAACAKKYKVCPFELSLDVSYWVDAIICDYNYVFDPHVRLQRYFADGERGEYIFLVDEAHNLVERAREMYSAKLEKEEFLAAKKYYEPFKSVVKQINSCNRKLLELKRECDVWKVLPEGEGIGSFVMALERLYEALNRLSETHQEWTAPKEASEFFFHVRDFLEVYEQLNEHYEVYMEHTSQGTFQINLLCVNPAERLQECCTQGISTIFFSATLLPIRYYKELLGQGEESKAIYAASPFDPKNRFIVTAADVSSKYTRRTASEYIRIGQYIKAITNSKRGNYLVFFPSYTFRGEVEAYMEKEENVRYIRQESSMTETQREEFLDAFREQDTPTVGFCVMGGIFSEGIDLQNEAVIGVIIVGTGLPQTGSRQEILKSHYEKEGKNGFLFAYLYPGMNKVLQAAGRLIRTSEDYGVIALLDERFLQGSYRSQFPPDWTDMNIVQLLNCTALLEQFWADIEQ